MLNYLIIPRKNIIIISNEQMQSSMKNNVMSQNQKQQEILELDKTITEQKNALVQAMHTLKSDIEAWKQRYIAIAPTTGKVIFLTSLQENQLVKTGQELLYILPNGEGFHGEMNIGQFNFGKVKRGQKIIVKLQSYPYEEYGTLRGQIQSISEIPKDSIYFVADVSVYLIASHFINTLLQILIHTGQKDG